MAINLLKKEQTVLKIGDFSKLAHLTVKTLRHYARIGLLKPAWTDRFTGYRYYTLQQLPQINRILALKDLGFSLEQISGLIDEEVSVKLMREMLRHKQVELEARLKAEQKRLEMVAARLLQIEQAGGRAGSEVLVKKVSALPVATLRKVVPILSQLPDRLNALVDELNNWMARSAIIANGPWMALYPAPEYRVRDIPIDLAVTVEPGLITYPPPKTASRVRLVDLRLSPKWPAWCIPA